MVPLVASGYAFACKSVQCIRSVAVGTQCEILTNFDRQRFKHTTHITSANKLWLKHLCDPQSFVDNFTCFVLKTIFTWITPVWYKFYNKCKTWESILTPIWEQLLSCTCKVKWSWQQGCIDDTSTPDLRQPSWHHKSHQQSAYILFRVRIAKFCQQHKIKLWSKSYVN